jgi:hypothetical protein
LRFLFDLFLFLRFLFLRFLFDLFLFLRPPLIAPDAGAGTGAGVVAGGPAGEGLIIGVVGIAGVVLTGGDGLGLAGAAVDCAAPILS